MRLLLGFVALLVIGCAAQSSDYTPPIPVLPGAAGRLRLIQSKNLPSKETEATDETSDADEAGEPDAERGEVGGVMDAGSPPPAGDD
jgi:hypothetical protein